MDENKEYQEPQDVVFLSPDMLKWADRRRRRNEEHLAECERAAAEGNADAQVQMGLRYLYGTDGVERDKESAFYWFSRTAPDDPVGRYWLAVCYDGGIGVERDPIRASQLFHESAEMDYPPALCDLGVCYENGQGVEKDMDKAIVLYRRAADAGYAMGQCNFGGAALFRHRHRARSGAGSALVRLGRRTALAPRAIHAGSVL